MSDDGRKLVGAGVLVLCGQYFVAEIVASMACRDPPYSFTQNYISDLGVIACTARVCSPLHSVMNAGFVAAGLLSFTAALLLAGFVRSRAVRGLLLPLAACHAVGTMTVGLVPSAPGSAAGTPMLHLAGAYLAIIAGNLALIVVGAGTPAPRRHRALSAGLGGVGIAAGAALVLTRTDHPGLYERLAADTVPLWEVLTGVLLLRPDKPSSIRRVLGVGALAEPGGDGHGAALSSDSG